MSIPAKLSTKTLATLRKKRAQGQKLVSLTCYDYSTARLLDGLDLDFLLVGDSLAMTLLGHPNTLSITVDEMLHHTKAVTRGATHSVVIADMPFMSYQIDVPTAVRNAGRFIQEAGAHGVKLEGASPLVLEAIRHLTSIGIPVLGHLGFTPQSLHQMGGYKVQGKTIADAKRLLDDAKAVEAAGAFGVVLEMVPTELATLISNQIGIPTIGIGSGNGCGGQILVIDDLLGRYAGKSPRFVRQYLSFNMLAKDAIDAFITDCRTQEYPDNSREAFAFDADMLPDLYLELIGETPIDERPFAPSANAHGASQSDAQPAMNHAEPPPEV